MLVLNVVVVLACFVTAVAIFYGSEKANDRKVVTLARASGPKLTLPTATQPDGTPDQTTEVTLVAGPVDMTARNFLITGSDNGACVDPDSPYTDAFGNRSGLGERADTIMILRLDPNTNASAVLSFPRDLWVKIAGRSSSSRINSAFNRDDPNTLVETIWNNFGVPVDHYVNVDFCAFKQIVDAVGGVRVPFATGIRDRNTGLLIEDPGCHTFLGEEGLAYVRSRKLQYFDEDSRKWREDPAADRGRISRQQDFLRRALQKALDVGAGSPTVAKQLIDAGLEFVILDDQLTPGKLLELAQAMRDLDPNTMKTYQIEGTGKMINGNSVIEPNIKSESMKAVLAVFKGEARLVDAPPQLVEDPTSTTTTTRAPSGSTTSVTGTTTSTTTLPPVFVESDEIGVLPTDDPACR
ncbi:MAG: LCP family protein [Actinomycetota bacterium]|nr:LCP family protein [Actinomycetota bacterium]MDA3012393.1 LCP family protein [Actinomycetota bacterium]MDA3024947.1 LCP family protein [Actinomycetota bacterium]